MESASYSEFVGIAPRTSSLIETFRESPDETKDQILLRVLQRIADPKGKGGLYAFPGRKVLDLGQGAGVLVGEKLYLFLSLEAKKAGKPDGVAIARAEGLEVDGVVSAKSKGSFLQPAMVKFQERLNHRNKDGEIISLSAWRQWHVHRDGQWIRLFDLKAPDLTKTRRGKQLPFSPDEIGL